MVPGVVQNFFFQILFYYVVIEICTFVDGSLQNGALVCFLLAEINSGVNKILIDHQRGWHHNGRIF